MSTLDNVRLKAILETSVNAIVCTNSKGIVDVFNPAAEKLFGYTADEIIGRPVNLLMPESHSRKHDAYIDSYKKTKEKKIIGIGRETTGKHKDGREFPIYLSVGEARIENEQFFVGIIHDISQRKQQEKELEEHRQNLQKLVDEKTEELINKNKELQKLVNIDGLTNLANRRYFDEVLQKEIKRAHRYKHSLSLLLCDVDFFKSYNDLYGHTTGDFCLKQFANCMEKSFKRPSDLVARYGGEEFAVIMPHTNLEEATKLAEVFLGNIRKLAIPHESSTASDIVTASIGVATLLTNELIETTSLINLADQELYSAKQAGRNRIETTVL